MDKHIEVKSTPAANWRQEGKTDPHNTRYECQRVDLTMGQLTDDEIANAVFLCDHRTSFDSIVYLTAAKDRIRWLSRSNEALIAQLEAAQKERDDLLNQEFQQRLANAEHQLYMKDLAIHNIKASRKAQFRKRLAAEAALSAANERVSQEYPETLPCPVRLEPGLLLGKGLPIAMLFRALSRRADYEAEIAAMTLEQRVEHDQRTREVKKFISECITPRPAGFTVEGE
ncbi:hypothetical protein RSG32_000023 [Yersinia enterocolitica]|nr:hypothetical protein [Yersinia enterocolitica]